MGVHRSPVKLVRNPVVRDDVWPDGLWPLVVRGMDAAGEWLHGAMVRVEPAAGVLYDTREPMPREWRNTRWDCQVRALVPPGEYRVTFEHPDLEYEHRVVVEDPTARMSVVEFRDGAGLRVRAGTWDDFIVKEQPYGRLPIRSDDVVMDVGAHIGTFTRDALRRGAAGVIAYEPEQVNVRLLRENTRGLPVTVVQGALVGDAAEGVTLWIDGVETGRNALHSVSRSKGDRLPVKVPAWNFTKELYRVGPGVVKVDVEEAEWGYDWDMPPSVHSLAVELERPRAHEGEIARIRAALGAQGFEELRSPGTTGWATTGVWTREAPDRRTNL